MPLSHGRDQQKGYNRVLRSVLHEGISSSKLSWQLLRLPGLNWRPLGYEPNARATAQHPVMGLVVAPFGAHGPFRWSRPLSLAMAPFVGRGPFRWPWPLSLAMAPCAGHGPFFWSWPLTDATVTPLCHENRRCSCISSLPV